MRILVLFGNIPLLGKERGNIQALKVLQEQGADVLFVTNKEWGHESIEPTLDALGLAWTPMTVARPLRRAMSWRDALGVARDVVVGWVEFYRAVRKYRPTHIHVPNEYQSLYNIPVLLLARRPIVYRLGDEPGQTPGLLRRLWEGLFVPRVDAWVCVSEYIRERILQMGAAPERVRVIYSYPPERTPAARDERFGATPFEGTTVAYMGQLAEHKGVDLLIEAAVALCRARDDVRFFIAGDYSWQNPFAQELIREVAAAGLDERIRFLGYVRDIPGLLAAADLHVCPSVWEEPLSNTVVEAKRAGIPSVIFPSGGLTELIRHGEDGFVCQAKTADALCAGIEHYLEAGTASLREAGIQAEASLERLGITRRAFAMAWLNTYRGARGHFSVSTAGTQEPATESR